MSDPENNPRADQCGYHRVERIPAIRSATNPYTFTNHHRLPDGRLGERVTEAEATHWLIHHFWIEPVVEVGRATAIEKGEHHG